jgi:phosphomevalonate kinase
MVNTAVAVSAPGKVLITGGYLVLDPSYRGLVLGTNARFYTLVQRIPSTSSTASAVTNKETLFVHVSAPQFIGAHWVYSLDVSPGASWCFVDTTAL